MRVMKDTFKCFEERTDGFKLLKEEKPTSGIERHFSR